MRFPSRPVALYASIGAVWIVLARAVVPVVLASAYRGRGIAPFVRWVQARFHRPLAHYLGLWADFSNAVLLALVLHLGLVLLAFRWGLGPGSEAASATRRRRFAGTILGLAGLFLVLAVLSGPRQDYTAYLEIWEAVGRGRDPWWIAPSLGYALNAYGPLFVVMAPLASWIPLAPKLLFAASYLVLVLHLARWSPESPWRRLTLVLSPFFWVEIAYFGHFDVLVALACLGAVSARLQGKDTAAGLGLGLGFLLKFIPLALLPFLALDGRRVRLRLLAVATVVMATGMFLANLAWGPSALRPLGFAYVRKSNFASIFRFLRGSHSPLWGLGGPPDLDALSVPCLLVFGLATLWVCLARRFGADASSILAALVVTTFYKVGFLQYQMVPALLLVSWCWRHGRTLAESPPLEWAVAGYLGWLTLLDLLLVWGGGVIHPGDPLGWLEDVVGLPTFVLSVLLWFALVRASRDPTMASSPELATGEAAGRDRPDL